MSWQDIKDYPYQISDTGLVRNKKGKILKPQTSSGYKRHLLSNGESRKQFLVHRLVARYFCDNIDNKPEVNHINGNKNDNRAENLEWVTAKENTNHAIDSGLRKRVTYARKVRIDDTIYESITEAARQLDMHRTSIRMMLRGTLKNRLNVKYCEVADE